MTSPFVAFPQSILGVDLYKTRVMSLYIGPDKIRCLLLISGSRSGSITKIFEFSPEGKSLFLRTGEIDFAVLASMFSKIATQVKSEKVQEIKLILPSWLCSFKTVDVLFWQKEKIEITLPFQIEGLLPIEVEHASTDFVVQEQRPDKTSSIFLAAIDSKILQNIEKLATKAELPINSATVDVLGYWGQARDLGLLSGHKLILVVRAEHMIMIFTSAQSIVLVKHVWGGASDIAAKAAESLGQPLEDLLTTLGDGQELLRLEPGIISALAGASEEFCKKINQACQAYSSKADAKLESTILFCEPEVEAVFSIELERCLGIKANRVPIEQILSHVSLKNRASYSNQTLLRWIVPILSISSRSTSDFNLGRKIFQPWTRGYNRVRLGAFVFLFLAIIGYGVFFNYFRLGAVESTFQAQEDAVVQKLKAAVAPYTEGSLRRMDVQKLSARLEELIDQMQSGLIKAGDADLAPLDTIVKVTNRSSRMLMDLKLEKIKSQFEGPEKHLKLKGVFKRSTVESDADKFFDILKINLKCDQKNLKFKENEGFSVTFVKNLWQEETK